MATTAGTDGLYLWSKIYSLKKDRYMKHDCLGGLPGRDTCKEANMETVKTVQTGSKLWLILEGQKDKNKRQL